VTLCASSRTALVCLDEKWTRLPSGAPRLYQHYNRERARPPARAARLGLGNFGATLSRMTSVAGIVALVVVLVPLAIVGAVFVWAARKDGAEDKALQARLGIRRKTRLGR
jgi:hypothetical protein